MSGSSSFHDNSHSHTQIAPCTAKQVHNVMNSVHADILHMAGSSCRECSCNVITPVLVFVAARDSLVPFLAP